MKSIVDRFWLPLFSFVLFLELTGCSVSPVSRESMRRDDRKGTNPHDERVIVHRKTPSPYVQRLSRIADAPSRMMPFVHKPTRREISDETEQLLTDYLASNGLGDIYVCVNEYDPTGEWQRLKANRRIAPVWRYSFGVMSLIGYTLFPEPVFGANQYNCFTNRISMNLDEPVDILNTAAMAKDVSSQPWPGAYAAITFLPGVSMIPRIRAMNDVVAYAKDNGDWETERNVYRRIYPRIGMESSALAVFVAPLWWEIPLFGLGGSAVGHLAGRYVEYRRSHEIEASNVRPTSPVEERSQVIQAGDSNSSHPLLTPVAAEMEQSSP